MAGPDITVERITPAMAKRMLEGNTNNRKAKFVRIHRYAADMAAGRWQITGEAIKFNGSQLLDGQNRLYACIEADTPFTTVVVRGLEDDAMDVLDSGAVRTTADALALRGYSNTAQVAAAAKMVLQWRGGRINDSGWTAANITPTMVIEFADANHDIFNHAVETAYAPRRALRLITTSVAAFLFEAHTQGFGDAADNFMATTVEGADIPKGDPRLALRNWAINIGINRRVSIPHLHACVTAWNASAAGSKLSIIRPWFKTGPFPTLKTP